MRDFPAIVRSAVLDSVVPPQIGVISDSPATFDRALNLDFSLCVAQGACHASVPVLRADFAQAVDQLNATPATVHAVDPTTRRAYDLAITGDRLVYLIQEWLYFPDAIGRVPELIEEVKAGTTTTLSDLIAQRFFARIISLLDLGVFFSVGCSDLVAPADATASRAGLLPAIRESRTLDGIYVLDTCAAWPVARADGAERQPVRGDMPTLILESANDPVTPPSYGELVASALPRSFVVEGPGAGHGVSSTSCGMQMTAAFFTDPTRKPDTTCTTDWGVSFNSTT
jgi:pimeloyl-ACP methyl ester carboxylesterase